MRRGPLALCAALLVVLSGTAQAHVSLDKSSVPADSDQSLQVRVPGENPPAYTVKLVLEVPAGFTALTCADKVGWTCALTQDTTNGRSAIITWTRESGVDAVDLFDLVVHTPTRSGDYPFEAAQSYSDGTKVFWDGPPDSDRPAPVLTVTGGGTAPQAAPTPSVHTVAPTPTGRATTPATPAPVSRGPRSSSVPTSATSASASPSTVALPSTSASDPLGGDAASSAQPQVEASSTEARSTTDSGRRWPAVLLATLLVGAAAGLVVLMLRRRVTP